MTATDHLLMRLATEMGGLDAGPVQRVEHDYLPWKKRCHAHANVLDIDKIISTEEKRRGVESLGAEVDGQMTYYNDGSSRSRTSCSRSKFFPPKSSRAKWMRSRQGGRMT